MDSKSSFPIRWTDEKCYDWRLEMTGSVGIRCIPGKRDAVLIVLLTPQTPASEL